MCYTVAKLVLITRTLVFLMLILKFSNLLSLKLHRMIKNLENGFNIYFSEIPSVVLSGPKGFVRGVEVINQE